jgi:hypothetical protein
MDLRRRSKNRVVEAMAGGADLAIGKSLARIGGVAARFEIPRPGWLRWERNPRPSPGPAHEVALLGRKNAALEPLVELAVLHDCKQRVAVLQ